MGIKLYALLLEVMNTVMLTSKPDKTWGVTTIYMYLYDLIFC